MSEMFPNTVGAEKPKEEAYKDTEGKIQLELLPFEALEMVAMVATQGAKRVAARNWEKGMPWGQAFGAAMRHMIAFWNGEDIDRTHKLPHLAHAAWWILCLLWYWIMGKGTDDRPKADNKHWWSFKAYFLPAMNEEKKA